MAINYFFEEIKSFTINKNIEKMINKAVTDAKKTLGELNYIFCSDKYLLKINKEYLNHDYFTDIITFDNTNKKIISGDVFISKERVKENAETFNVRFENELNRVMIHGVLHLLGYKDESEEQKLRMRHKEEQYMIQ